MSKKKLQPEGWRAASERVFDRQLESKMKALQTTGAVGAAAAVTGGAVAAGEALEG
jgi:hypothetical protein